ncbi:MAG: UDP-N-acetylglucosamine--N-acetylmuramyl-(pentapeptide) pyrophosphoryl-undecaprenol N-acetylglucosamine transferase, partial [Candidatus Pacebacteria bacterium]|nr:UDP-N-acetylglucosamine--N-acetylmuramyl-(pentapeptide) pyrophosphoryl-undecaprenol N-acetylglucosamine transferase [Candidatus Paceibacterota bacterium]
DILKIPVGIIQSLYYIYKFKPDIVFSKGGFASVPPVIASWVLKIPIITHESDIVPGLANRIIARFASKILISFSAAEKYFDKSKVILTGNPIRSDIEKGSRENALEFFKLSPDLPTVLIFGGSQGAQKINEMVLEILPNLIEKCQIIHQCGDKNYKEIKNKISELNLKYPERYRVYPFIKKEMKDAFALADIVISRAGANSLAEIVALQKPNILIPLSTSANNHQPENAKFFAEKNASLIIDETVSNSQDLADAILKLLSDKNLQNKIKQKLSELAPSQNASRKIAEEILIRKP